MGSWGRTLSDPLQSLHLDPDVGVAVMTYASEMYAWYAGSVEADACFCPERQGTPFEAIPLLPASRRLDPALPLLGGSS